MSTTAQNTRPPGTRVRWGVADAFFWLALALISSSILALPVIQLAIASPLIVETLSYLLVWVFLLCGVFVASYLRGRRSLAADFGLRFAWIDLLWGLGLGLLLRGVSTIIETAIYGSRPSGSVVIDGETMTLIATVALAVAAAVVSPVVEELFFRGLVQRAVLTNTGGSSTTSTIIAVAVSSIVFALVHMLQLPVGTAMLAVGASTLVTGIALGTLAALTGRLGGAIVAHVAFNATIVLGLA